MLGPWGRTGRLRTMNALLTLVQARHREGALGMETPCDFLTSPTRKAVGGEVGTRLPSPESHADKLVCGYREAKLAEPNTRGKEDLERRNHELSVLNEIASKLNRYVELGEPL